MMTLFHQPLFETNHRDVNNFLFTYAQESSSNNTLIYCFGKLSNSTQVCNNRRGNCTEQDVCECETNWYGNECQITSCFGILQNETTSVCNSHGTCSNTDSCSCSSNWFGNDCNITSCYGVLQNDTAVVCKGHGECTATNVCECDSGWSGAQCGTFSCFGIVQNASNVCNSHGNCTDLDTCNCKVNWFGSDCNVTICNGVLQNDTAVCSGRGVCVSTNQCQCPQGYTGNNCEIPICFGVSTFTNVSSVICSGHGSCIDTDICQCNSTYTGPKCQYPICYGIPSNDTVNACSGSVRGTCSAPNTCSCNSGYTGSECQYNICYGYSYPSSNLCYNKGDCIAPNTCNCTATNYTGSDCSYELCSPSLPCWRRHGSCASETYCACNTDWTGPSCNIPICYSYNASDTANVCSNHGTCVSDNACSCVTGWKGNSNCSVFSCDGQASCSGHGDCVGPNNCSCYDGWKKNQKCSAVSCELVGNCYSHGTCSGPNTCSCNAGWKGASNCSVFSCELRNACSGHGDCIGANTCSCVAGWQGDTSCSTVSCELVGNCYAHGTCSAPNTCTCDSGWRGASNCSQFTCDGRNYCSGHGTCNGANTCTCDSGWKGNSNCSAISCDALSNCGGASKGTCVSNNTCSCKTGWRGAIDCSVFTCDERNYCSGHGTCNGANTCTCDSGWKGNSNCSTITCDALGACNGHGTCISNNTCSCNSGWTAANCNTFTCKDRDYCSGHGTCTGANTCTCDSGWKGNSNCSAITCDGVNSCSQNGDCIGNNTCQCRSGWTGASCNVYTCDGSSNCNSNGLCIGNNTCQCYSGWKGNAVCSQFSCDGVSGCSQNGVCIGNNTCQCRSGWSGPKCDIFTCDGVLNCYDHGLCISNNTCQCQSGWKGSSNCSVISCDGVNSCSQNGQCVGNNTCQCRSGWTGSNCNTFTCDASENCHNNGLCISNNTCQCDSGWRGNSECSAYSCDGVNYCSSHGNCTGANVCNCTSQYTGPRCDIPVCFTVSALDPNVCSSNGSCIAPDTCSCLSGFSSGGQCNRAICYNRTNEDPTQCNGKGICTAPDVCYCTDYNYYGKNCTDYNCFGLNYLNNTVCSGFGKCTLPNNCSCNAGYSGNNCQYVSCFGNNTSQDSKFICSGKGSCISPDKCSCVSGYTGDKCQYPICFGINSTMQSVCSGFGQCIDTDTCSCNYGHGGSNCEILKCENILANSSNVCNQRGSCINVDLCNCTSTYSGNNCQFSTCFGKNSTDAQVCNGKGQCNAENACSCSVQGYFGEECTLYQCYSLYYNDTTNVCSGHGQCKSPNNCECVNGYTGENCQTPICFGVNATSLDVCSANGACNSPNTCQCTSGWFGKNCNITQDPITVSLEIGNVPLATYSVYNNISSLALHAVLGELLPQPYVLENVIYNWTCSNCQANNGSDSLSNATQSIALFNVYALPTGTFNLELSALAVTSEDGTVFYRHSNTFSFNITILQVPESYSVSVVGVKEAYTISTLPTSLDIVVPTVSLNQSALIRFLGCSNGGCVSKKVEYSLVVRFNYTLNMLDMSGNVTIVPNSALDGFTCSPYLSYSVANFKSQITNLTQNEESVLEIILEFRNQDSNSSFTITSTYPIIPPASAPKNVTKLVTITPTQGMALSENFVFTVQKWTAAESLKPLTYALGIYDSTQQKPVRITSYTTNSTFSSILPYLTQAKKSRSVYDETVTVILFVADKYGNEEWTYSSTVTVSPYNGTVSELLSILSSASSSEQSVLYSYDSSASTRSLSTNESQAILNQLIDNVQFDTKNPQSALDSLLSVTSDPSQLSSEMVDKINTKLANFVSNVTELYKEEKALYSFVKTKVLDSTVTLSTLKLVSNLLETGLSSEKVENTAENTADTALMGEIPTLLTTGSVPTLSFTTDMVNITISAFSLDKSTPTTNNQTLSTGINQVSLDMNSVFQQISNESTGSFGMSFIAYSINSKVDSFSKKSYILAPLTEFTLSMSDSQVELRNLKNPIALTFSLDKTSLSTLTSNKNITNTTMECRYWNETENAWLGNGCYVSSFVNGEVVCKCDHTTRFGTFLQFNLTSMANSSYKLQVASYYIAEIVFGGIYGIVSVIVLVLLTIFRNKQPIKSRLVAPYLGMIALLTECVLISIIRNSILVNELLSNTIKSAAYETDVTNVVNWFGGIASIIVNTLNLTAILAFLLQVVRYLFMKHLYNLMNVMRKKKEGNILENYAKKITTFKRLTSNPIYYTILCLFAVVNILYWTLWFVLKYTGVIGATDYTTIVSVSYCVVILTFALIVTLIFIADLILTYKFDDESKESSISARLTNQGLSGTEGKGQKKAETKPITADVSSANGKETIQISTILHTVWKWFVRRDTPLFYRLEMIFFVAFFIFLIVSQALGLASIEGKFSSSETKQFTIGLVFDSARFAIETVYIVFYILAFGGFASLVSLRNFYKNFTTEKPGAKKGKKEEVVELENEELAEVVSDAEGINLFEEFCKKEWSLENLYMYVDIKIFMDSLEDKMEDSEEFLKHLYSYCVSTYEVYIKLGATMEVNIPSHSRNSFLLLFKMVVEQGKNQPFVDKVYESILYGELNTKKTKSMPMQSMSARPIKMDFSQSSVKLVDEQKKAEANNTESKIMWVGYQGMVNGCVDSLYQQIVMNLGDTFSRFIFTDEYKTFAIVNELKQRMKANARFEL